MLAALITEAPTYCVGELEATIDRGNEPSLRLAAKLGFAARSSIGTSVICSLGIDYALQRIAALERTQLAFERIDAVDGVRPTGDAIVAELRAQRERRTDRSTDNRGA